jgi:hypothetical protein
MIWIILSFVAGLFVGVALGIFVQCLMVAAKDKEVSQ